MIWLYFFKNYLVAKYQFKSFCNMKCYVPTWNIHKNVYLIMCCIFVMSLLYIIPNNNVIYIRSIRFCNKCLVIDTEILKKINISFPFWDQLYECALSIQYLENDTHCLYCIVFDCDFVLPATEFESSKTYGPLARYLKLGVAHARECRERFPRHRWLAIPACIRVRARRTSRDACWDRCLAVSFEVGGR